MNNRDTKNNNRHPAVATNNGRWKTTCEPCFSNGTEFEAWQTINCDRCIKAVWYNPKTDSYPQYRCAVQAQIEGQVAGFDEINTRTWEIAQRRDCPFRTETRQRKKTIRRQSDDDILPNQLSLFGCEAQESKTDN